MEAGANADWRNVLRAYLDAQWEDLRRKHQSDLTNCESLCLREFGVDAVCRDYEQMIRRRLDAHEPPPRETELEVVEESVQRVVAQVDKNRGRELPLVTRFTLEKLDNRWRISAVTIPCVGCSPIIFQHTTEFFTPQNGRCVFCHGSGQAGDFSKRRFWFLRSLARSKTRCTFCDGQRVCQRCLKSLDKGWINAFTWEGELGQSTRIFE